MGFGRVRSCNTSEDDYVGNAVSAHAVRAVNAARHFTRGEEPGDGVSVRIENMRVAVGPGSPRKFAIVRYGNFDKFP